MKQIIIFNAGPLHNQSAGIHVYTKQILHALHTLHHPHLHWILLTEKPTSDFPNFEVIPIPTIPFLPGFATLRLFLIFPLIALFKKATWVVEPAHFGPFHLPKKIKRVTVIHDLTPVLYPQWHTFNSRFLQKLFLPSILRNSTHIVTVSHHTQSDLEHYEPQTQGKITVIYPGISPAFTPQPSTTSYDPYILFTGTLEPRKNVVTLINAFTLLKSQPAFSHYRLLLIGKKGWKNEALEDALNSCPYRDAISIKGYVTQDELIKAYSNSAVFVYPSLYEGFGFPVLEAMACGAKVITSNLSSLKEISKDHAFLLNHPTDPRELADLMIHAIHSTVPPGAMQYAKTYRWEKTAQSWLNLFNILPTENPDT